MRNLKIEFLKKYNDFLTEKDIEKLINKRVEELSFDTAFNPSSRWQSANDKFLLSTA